jgi:site-specific DNA recombinase
MIQKAKTDAVFEKKSVGIWLRVSTEDQAQGESPEHHRRRAEMYAESKGWTVAKVYDLSGVSGKTVMDHPQTQAMLADVAAGRITSLIFSKLARLARNTRECLDFAEYFEKFSAGLVSLGESIDTSTPAGRLFYTVIAAMAQWEREEIASRVKESVKVRAKLGKDLGGAAPFGYRKQDGMLVLDETEAPIRRRMFELFLEHKRLKTVAAQMNSAGLRTRSGGRVSDTTIRRLLEDPAAKGVRRSNYSRSLGQKRAWTLKPESEWSFTRVEPVVSEELWDACNAILTARKDGARPVKKAIHLFTGLAVCECGGTMTVKWKSPNYTCRKCKRKIGIRDLEEVFRDQLRSFFLSPEEVRSYLEQGNAALTEKRELLAAMQAEHTAVRIDMDKVYQLYMDDVITTQGFGDRYKPLEGRAKELADEIPRLQGEADFLAIQHLSSEEIVSEAQDLYGRWDTLLSDEKRAVAETVLERITVSEETVSIALHYAPTSPPTAVIGQRNHRVALPRPNKDRERKPFPRRPAKPPPAPYGRPHPRWPWRSGCARRGQPISGNGRPARPTGDGPASARIARRTSQSPSRRPRS